VKWSFYGVDEELTLLRLNFFIRDEHRQSIITVHMVILFKGGIAKFVKVRLQTPKLSFLVKMAVKVFFIKALGTLKIVDEGDIKFRRISVVRQF
jgi:hypothetical protein